MVEFTTYAEEATLWVGASEWRLRVDLGLEVGSVGALLELRHGPTSYRRQLRGVGGRRCARRPLLPVVDGV